VILIIVIMAVNKSGETTDGEDDDVVEAVDTVGYVNK
jgi:hypothetical protein